MDMDAKVTKKEKNHQTCIKELEDWYEDECKKVMLKEKVINNLKVKLKKKDLDNTLEIEKRYITKIQQLEKVLKMKIDQLLSALKDKG